MTQSIAALQNTPIACLFVGQSLVVYYFGPVGSVPSTRGSPLMRAITQQPEKPFRIEVRPSAPTPNGYTQLTAHVDPNSTRGESGGVPATVIISYVQDGSGQIVPYQDIVSESDLSE